MKKMLYLLFAIAALSSCTKKIELSNDDYLIFGHFYGECIGESCVEYFRLEKNQILEDTTDNYLFENNCGCHFIKLSDEDFQKVKDLTDYFPNELLNESDTIFGCPDCADGGGIYVEYNYNGIHKKWRFDKIKENVPEKYHEFLTKIEEYISIINQVKNK